MIVFISVFLGLITGIQPVELAVSGAATEVELRLDGEVIGLLRAEPWRLDVDFGDELATHELVAVARGARGEELDRAVQLINVPRPPVDAQILLEGWHAGRPRSARLVWRSVEPMEPVAVSVHVDGEVLADRYAGCWELPDLDPGSIHFLGARLEFSDGLTATAEAVFGGAYGDSAETELTAVPLRIGSRKLRALERLQGRLKEDGDALRAVALEDGPAEVVIVRDHRALASLATLAATYRLKRRDFSPIGLAKDDVFLVLSPRPYVALHPDARYAIYPLSPPMSRGETSLLWTLASIKYSRRPMLPQRLPDAVATAGLRAASSQKRRAVVLVTSDCAEVSGQWSPQGVRRFLAALRVPFRVWQVEPPLADAPVPATGSFCDGAQPIHEVRLFYAAVKRLRRDLSSQQIVWVEGRHLLREITFDGDEPGVRLAE